MSNTRKKKSKFSSRVQWPVVTHVFSLASEILVPCKGEEGAVSSGEGFAWGGRAGGQGLRLAGAVCKAWVFVKLCKQGTSSAGRNTYCCVWHLIKCAQHHWGIAVLWSLEFLGRKGAAPSSTLAPGCWGWDWVLAPSLGSPGLVAWGEFWQNGIKKHCLGWSGCGGLLVIANHELVSYCLVIYTQLMFLMLQNHSKYTNTCGFFFAVKYCFGFLGGIYSSL